MNQKRVLHLSLGLWAILGAWAVPIAQGSDATLQLSSTNGSTGLSIRNISGIEISSFTSSGSFFTSGTIFAQTARTPVTLGGFINRDTSNISDSNSTTETQLYAVPIPANLFGVSRGVRIVMRGQFTQNSGATRAWALKLKLGTTFAGAAVVATKSSNITASATAGDFFAQFILANTGASNSQEGAVSFLGDRNGSPVSICGTGLGSVDTTLNQTLYVSITFPVNTATQTFTKTAAYAVLE